MKCYNWYKTAGGFYSRIYPSGLYEVTSDQFQSMTWREKQQLGWNEALSPEVQLLFFTEEYAEKSEVLQALASNPSLTPEVQPLFFTEDYEWENRSSKNEALKNLALNESIAPATQLLFFKPEYWINGNGFPALYYLAQNTSLTSLTQRMLFTEEYPDKNGVINYLKRNPSFLKGFTLQEMREFTKAKEARLLAYSKRLKQSRNKISIREKIKL